MSNLSVNTNMPVNLNLPWENIESMCVYGPGALMRSMCQTAFRIIDPRVLTIFILDTNT